MDEAVPPDHPFPKINRPTIPPIAGRRIEDVHSTLIAFWVLIDLDPLRRLELAFAAGRF